MLVPQITIIVIVLSVHHGTQLGVGRVVSSTLGWDSSCGPRRRAL